MTTRIGYGIDAGANQSRSLPFRLTLTGQAIAALAFGLVPLIATGTYATTLRFSGDEPLIYRLGGAATMGYFVVAVVALAWKAGWSQVRIPAIATVTFTIGVLVAGAWEFLGGAKGPIVTSVMAAGAVGTLIAAFWLWNGEASPEDPGERLDTPARAILALATLSAATFGLLPLLVPTQFATLFGLAGTDHLVFRLAGAGCLGYAVAGIASLRASGYRQMRLQNLAAISFNGIAAVSAWIAIVSGNGGLLAPVVAAAATFFTIALLWVDGRFAR